MSGHVDAESLALYAEGQLSRRRTARVRAHLSGCADCARTAAALTEVTTQLSQVAVPPMPSAVAARLDAALSAESARRAAAPDAAPAPARAGAPEPRPPRRGPLWSPGALRILAATGATLVVAGGVGYVLSQSGSSGQASSGSVPAASHRSPVKGAPNHSAGASSSTPHNKPQLLPGAIAGGSGAGRVVHSGMDYRTKTLRQQAVRTLGESRVTGGQPLSSLTPTLHACVTSVAHKHAVSLVDRARFDQHPAVMIVLASALGTPDRVIAVTPSCSPLASAALP
jgi:pyruvate/2-oxoglutarate dehydrogenase complex dihydrolipoamide acyltransferase (E2) component